MGNRARFGEVRITEKWVSTNKELLSPAQKARRRVTCDLTAPLLCCNQEKEKMCVNTSTCVSVPGALANSRDLITFGKKPKAPIN